MFRPGGFPEYSPTEQKIFDNFTDTLRKHFEQANYAHIHTPAVEPVDILSRWGDIFDKQVYGLYGLAQVSQGQEDYKDYALHFDLTIPFARYVLDHMNELTFPFKRYQIQPVWRGERQKRWRYKEFWQCDIDAIWRADMSVGVWYDAEAVNVMYRWLQEVFANNHCTKNIIVRLSHIRIIKSLLFSRWTTTEQNVQVFKILDDRYKRNDTENTALLHQILTSDQSHFLKTIIIDKDLSLVHAYDGYEDLLTITQYLSELQVPWEFALPIVRGHGYYTGMVAEFFDADDIGLWAIAGGGRYEQLTDFIDPKQSFSGVGISVSNRVMELLLNNNQHSSSLSESYFFVYFEDTKKEILWLYSRFLAEWKICELYPVATKFGKQLDYADKKWMYYAVILWASELAEWSYILKNMQTGKQMKLSLAH